MAAWNYLIPAFSGSRWDKPSAPNVGNTVTETEWPRIGVYCPHGAMTWLVGSLVVSAEVLRVKDKILWAWETDYMCGDGVLIRLNRQRAGRASQSIVDDAPHDADELNRRLFDSAWGSAESKAISDQIDRANATMRTRIIAECGNCGERHVFRGDSVQPVAAAFWAAGVREVTLHMLAEGVARVRT